MFDMFKFARMLDTTDGQLSLMGTPISIVPTDLLCEQQRMLIQILGIEHAYQNIYLSSKKGAYSYNKEFIKKQKFEDKRKIIDWQMKIVTFAGWGEVELALSDLKNNEFKFHFKNSPYPKSYGQTKYPVDFVAAGFAAGGLSVVAGVDLDAVETKCISKGDPFCEIEISTPEIAKEKRINLWKKLEII